MTGRSTYPARISYLVAVRNKAGSIGRCLDCLTKQYVDQIVVVDGKSSDGTSEIIDTFQVTHLYDNGKGLSIARNIGLAHCIGDYIVTLDGDEWIPDDFDHSLKLTLATGRYDIIFCQTVPVGASPWSRAHQAEFVEVETVRSQVIDDPFDHRPKVIKHSLLFRINGWDESMISLEDRDLWRRVEQAGATVYMSELPIYHDISDISVLSEYKRGRWYGCSVASYIKRYPDEWHKLVSLAPVGWIFDIFFAYKILLRTRTFKLAFLSLMLRMARSIGWSMGAIYSIFVS